MLYHELHFQLTSCLLPTQTLSLSSLPSYKQINAKPQNQSLIDNHNGHVKLYCSFIIGKNVTLQSGVVYNFVMR